MKTESRTARLAWTIGLAIAWPITAIAAFHLAWGREPSGVPPVLGFLGIGVLFASPGALAIAAAEESARWRRIIAGAVATTSALTTVGYGMLMFETVGCGQSGGPAEVALSMLPVAMIVGMGAGFTAWQGGRLVTAYRRVGIPLAFVVGWAMLALGFAAAIFRGISVSCFGY